MNIRCFRIVRRARAEQCFDGEGARLFGGRWNSKGKRVVYTSESMSLAILETLIHLESHEALGRLYCVRTATFPLPLCEHLRPALLPDGWNNDLPINATRRIGDNWLTASRSAVLAVPSVFPRRKRTTCSIQGIPIFVELN